MSVGTNIKYYRKLNNLTQKDLGDRLEVSDKTISSWEKDRTEPNMGLINKMCDIFHCNASNISDGVTKEIIPDYDADLIEIIDLLNKITKEQKQSILSMLRSFANQ